MRVHQLDAEVPKHWDDVRLNDAIIAQLMGSGHIPGPDLKAGGNNLVIDRLCDEVRRVEKEVEEGFG